MASKEISPNPNDAFDLTRGLLGPNLKLRAQLSDEEFEAMVCEDEERSFKRIAPLPFSTLGPQLIFATSKIYKDTYETFGLERIAKIAQLGILQLGKLMLPSGFPDMLSYSTAYKRWTHCLTTAVLTELILRNNHAPEETVRQGVIAGLLHDAAITPLSDTVSAIDMASMSEEKNLARYIQRFSHSEFDQRYKPDYETILAAVRKEGVLGGILSLADKIAYTAHDCAVFAHVALKAKKRGDIGGDYFFELVPILEQYPVLFDIFQEVRLDQGHRQVYVEDADHLYAMLKIRVLMYREVYTNPQRLLRQAVVRAITKPLLEEGKLTIDDLLGMDDSSFLADIIYGSPLGILYRDASKCVGAVRYKTDREFQQAQEQLQQEAEQVFWVEEASKFDLGLNFLTLHNGQIATLRNSLPEKAAELEEIIWQASGQRIYYQKIRGK